MVYINGKPNYAKVRKINPVTLLAVDGFLSEVTISNPSNEYTSSNNVLAYRPSYSGGNTAILFVNLAAAFSNCGAIDNLEGISCKLFTREEESFQFGKPFIQASNIGNHFHIFSNHENIATYGFGVPGCSRFDPACITDFEVHLVCLLPSQCG